MKKEIYKDNNMENNKQAEKELFNGLAYPY